MATTTFFCGAEVFGGGAAMRLGIVGGRDAAAALLVRLRWEPLAAIGAAELLLLLQSFGLVPGVNSSSSSYSFVGPSKSSAGGAWCVNFASARSVAPDKHSRPHATGAEEGAA